MRSAAIFKKLADGGLFLCKTVRGAGKMRKALPGRRDVLNINGYFLMQRTVAPFIRQLGECMTQELLAEKLNASRQSSSKWEADGALQDVELLSRQPFSRRHG